MIGRRLGRWELVEKIGAGGMGKVFRATDSQSGAEVALKLLSIVNNDERLVARMKRESEALSRLRHPHIIRFHGVYATRQWLFYVMDYVPGMTLGGLVTSRYTMERRFVSIEEGMGIAAQLASALVHAHGHGVLHRDIKPDNILMHDDGRAILTDFGLAKVSDLMTLTGQGQVMGTVLYMSPEQLLGKSMDGRADVYQLGLVLYELFTGELPLMGDTAMDSTHRRLREAVPPPSSFCARIPPWLDTLLLNCLKLHPAQRYVSSSHLLDALREGAKLGNFELSVPDSGLEGLDLSDGSAPPDSTASAASDGGDGPRSEGPSSPSEGRRVRHVPSARSGGGRGLERAAAAARASAARQGDDQKSWIPLDGSSSRAVAKREEIPVWIAAVAGFCFVLFLAVVLHTAGLL